MPLSTTAGPARPASSWAGPPVLLVHGAGTTARLWDPVRAELHDVPVRAPDRRSSGDLTAEVADLAPWAHGALVVGVSGGATLGLALAASEVRLAGAIVHEPAVGSLLPGLLAPVAAAFAEDGVAGFGRTLYGRLWSLDMAPTDEGAVARDLAMFRAFEPEAPRSGQGPVLVTVGAQSPPERFAAAGALERAFGIRHRVVDGCAHLVPLEAPATLAKLVRSFRRDLAAAGPVHDR